MYHYHNNLKKLLSSESYICIKAEEPFAYRFVFTRINKSMPIREYRNAEYIQYIGGVE